MYKPRLKENPNKKLFGNSSHTKLSLLKYRKQNHWPGRDTEKQFQPPGKLRPRRTKWLLTRLLWDIQSPKPTQEHETALDI